MKLDRGLKIALIILLIILVSIISFFGLFVQEKNAMVNLVKDYDLGMDLEGYRIVALAVDESNETIYYDKDGKVVEEEAEDGTKKEVPVNKEEDLTTENYLKTKEIYEKRLEALGVSEYHIRQDENTGKILVQLPEDDLTDLAAQYLYTVGEFTVEDEDGNVLMNNSDLEGVTVGYNTETNGTTVYLNIKFNKDSVEKLREITNTYKTSTDEEENDSSKKITLKIDGNELVSTSFSEEISNGMLSLSVGTSTTASTINEYIQEASNIGIVLDNGNLPITYTVEQNRFIKSDITDKNIVIASLVTVSVILIALVVLIVIYRKNGVLASISYIGYVAVLLLVLRYANVIITIEGLLGILIAFILNYVFNIHLLKTLKRTANDKIEMSKGYNHAIMSMVLILIPAIIIGIVLCFVNWLPIYSFGAIIYWSILLILAYNSLVTRTLLLLSSKKQ